jgi:ribulose-phosphate 3-epimerase
VAEKASIKIAPSLLSADLLHLNDEIQALLQGGADWLHLDVMDGHYVPNITFGLPLVKAIRQATSLPLDVHLMISPAQPYLEAFASAGASILTIHPDADVHTHRLLTEIRSYGLKAGIALNPATPLAVLDHLLPFVDLILVMTVDPGFGGQVFIPEMLTKIEALRKRIDEEGYPILLEVDGGINNQMAPHVIRAGADVLVAGSAIFGTGGQGHSSHCYRKTISELKCWEEWT